MQRWNGSAEYLALVRELFLRFALASAGMRGGVRRGGGRWQRGRGARDVWAGWWEEEGGGSGLD